MSQETPILPERYQLQRLLGEGGLGRVYLVRDELRQENLACKVLRPAKSDRERENQLLSFQAEIQAAASLAHPRIVPIYDTGALEDGSPYFTMRLVSGGSLARFRAAPPPWPVLHKILDQLLEGIGYAHSRGIIHRDIKPHNVLLDRADRGGYQAFLADLSLVIPFGLGASTPRTNTQGYQISGTPPYMAPEQFDSTDRDIGPWTDLYAVGIMIFELVTGRLPFDGNLIEQVYAKSNHTLPPLKVRPNYAVPRGLEAIVHGLICRHPASRFELAADIRNALRSLHPTDLCFAEKDAATEEQQQLPTLLREDFTERSIEAVLVHREQQLLTEQDVPLRPKPVPPALPEEPFRESLSAATPSLSLYAHRRVTLTGQEEIIQTLWQEVSSVLKHRQTRIVFLEGETGLGKSRLARWLVESLEQLGSMRVIRVQEDAATQLSGLSGALFRVIGGWGFSREEFSQRLKTHLASHGVQDEQEVLSYLRWLFPKTHEELPSLEERHALFFKEVARVSWRGASCIWLDDVSLHWLTDGFLQKLQENAAKLQLPLLILVTPQDVGSGALPEQYGQLIQNPQVLRLHVDRLKPIEQREFVQRLLPLSEELTSFVIERTEGHPLYTMQLLGHWIDSGFLAPESQRSDVLTIAQGVSRSLLVPSSMTELFRNRLQEAISRSADPEATRESFYLAALLGFQFSWRSLQETVESVLLPQRAKVGIWAALTSGIIRTSQGGRTVRFEHAMAREAIYQEAIQRADAPNLHRLVASCLEKNSNELESLFQAAEHREAAGDGERAAQLYFKAGQMAFRSDIQRSLWAMQRALALGEADAETPRSFLGKVYVGLAHAARMQGENERSLKFANTALFIVDDDDSVSAEAWLELGRIERQRLQLSEAQLAFTRAYEHAVQASNKKILTRALIGLGDVAYSEGQWQEAFNFFSEAKKGAHPASDPLVAGRVLNRLGDVYRATGDIARASSHYEQARQESTKRCDRITEISSLTGLGDLDYLASNFRAAFERYKQAQSLAELSNFSEGFLFSSIRLTFSLLQQEDADAAFKNLEMSRKYLPEGKYWAKALWAIAEAWGYVLQKNTQRAHAKLMAAEEEGAQNLKDREAGLFAETCGDVALRHGFAFVSLKAYEIALRIFMQTQNPQETSRTQQKLLLCKARNQS